MIRRKFLKYFSGGLSIGFLQSPFMSVLLARQEYANQINFNFIDQSGKKYQLLSINKYGRFFISLKEFSDVTGFGIFTNTGKRKSVLYIKDTKIKFAAENPFVIINNEQNVQIFYKPIWKEGKIWMSVPELVSLISDYTGVKLNLNLKTHTISIGEKDINITRVNVITKQNGVMIELSTTKKFTEREIYTKKVNGWFYLEIVGGKLDVKAVNRKINNELISEIQALQFEQMASVAFRLKNEVVEAQLSEQENSDNVFLSLLTNKKLEKDLKARDELKKQKQRWMIDTIVIDPGHGGKDPGAVGYGKLKEKDIVLPVALKLGEALQKKLDDVKIVYTRKTDIFIPLWKRTKIANKANGKLFISLHCNSNESSKVRGFETYFLSAEQDDRAKNVVMKENQSINFEEVADKKRYEGINFVLATLAQNAFIKQSQYLASTVQKKMALKLQPEGMKDRGVKQGPFWVMVGATMPNILVEMGFISNKYESKLLKQKSMQQKLADSICEGIIKYKNDFESTI